MGDWLFTTDAIRPSGQGVVVTGALTVRDRTEPLSFPAMASVPGRRGPAGRRGRDQPS